MDHTFHVWQVYFASVIFTWKHQCLITLIVCTHMDGTHMDGTQGKCTV